METSDTSLVRGNQEETRGEDQKVGGKMMLGLERSARQGKYGVEMEILGGDYS